MSEGTWGQWPAQGPGAGPHQPGADVDLAAQLAVAEQRAAWAMARVGDLQAELRRMQEWRMVTVGAVVAVAVVAIVLFGVVAFNAVDDAGAQGAARAAAAAVGVS